jgi:hypothetical protein
MLDCCLTHHDAISSTKTGINFRLSVGLDGIYLFDLHQLIANIEQIERFYNRNLPLSKEMARGLQAFLGGGRMIYLPRKHFLDGAKREITNARQRRGQRVWQ